MTKEELIIKHNEMVVKIIKECDYMIRNRYYLGSTAIENIATKIKDFAEFYIKEAEWSDSKMSKDAAILYLTHTAEDDFNLEEYQAQNRIEAIKTILSLLKEKDKIIDKMAEMLVRIPENTDYPQTLFTIQHINSHLEEQKKKLIDYLEKKVEENDNDDK